jgi:hypothetical protein
MKIGFEAPTNLLEIVNPLGDFDFISVDQFMVDKEYARYFISKPPRLTLISTRQNHTLHSVPMEDIIKVIGELKRICYVIGPDTYRNMEETMSSYKNFSKMYDREYTIGVVQGKTIKECLDCSAYYGDWIALPFDVSSSWGGRLELVGHLGGKIIHLLGMTSLDELEQLKEFDSVQSLNTGLPVVAGLKGSSIADYLRTEQRDSRQYIDTRFEYCDGGQLDQILENIKQVRSICG